MREPERKTIHIPEICRVEGHAAVYVDIVGREVAHVKLDVFEGTRFFEKIVLGHHFEEIPHITSRVCAICSTGHILAAAFAVERILGFSAAQEAQLYRELMHLGMIIESHATHVYALALPDYLGARDLMEFATQHPEAFETWTRLRNLGAAIQTVVGGRPFHPVNVHVGGLSSVPPRENLEKLLEQLNRARKWALRTCELLMKCEPPVARTTSPVFLALVPESKRYGFFGDTVRSSDGWEDSIQNYRQYLGELAVPYSHAKRSTARGKPLMVGAMARLALFGDRLGSEAKSVYQASRLASGDTNSLWNNLAQAIEIVEAIARSREVINALLKMDGARLERALRENLMPRAGSAAGAVECPRGTLYHFYSIDEHGKIVTADMITPSAQNTARIELDIREVVEQAEDLGSANLQANLETLVRAYDPCNTCATHMVTIHYG